MTDYFIKEGDFAAFVDRLIGWRSVFAPVAKNSKFVYSKLTRSSELRLDFDVTILPPKKVLFPTTQVLVEFSPKGVNSGIRPVEQVLFGIHFYDIKAIEMLDQLFRENNPDENYLANRRATTIIGSNIQKISSRAFFASVGSHTRKGCDGFLTKLDGGYLFETFTPKGEALVAQGKFSKAAENHSVEAKRVNEAVLLKCPEKLPAAVNTIADRLRRAFENKALWDDLSKQCFSCGTCNVVCPTCYCFDVQDRWNLDQVSGTRARTWDGCQLDDFAKVSLGGGATENFREERSERFRHRILRKASYLNEKLGQPACVGCGRCSAGCVPDIADPVKISQRVLES